MGRLRPPQRIPEGRGKCDDQEGYDGRYDIGCMPLSSGKTGDSDATKNANDQNSTGKRPMLG